MTRPESGHHNVKHMLNVVQSTAMDLQRLSAMIEDNFTKMDLENIKESDLAWAFTRWLKPPEITDADQTLASRRPVSLKMARKARLVSTHELAKRLGISRSGYFQLEREAECGQVTITRLNEIAAAMECECFVSIRPINGKTFMSLIWQPLLKEALKKKYLVRGNPRSFYRVLGNALNETFFAPKFRRAQRWTRVHGKWGYDWMDLAYAARDEEARSGGRPSRHWSFL